MLITDLIPGHSASRCYGSHAAQWLDRFPDHHLSVTYANRHHAPTARALLAPTSTLVLDHDGYLAHLEGREVGEGEWDQYAQWARSIMGTVPKAVAIIPDVIGDTEANNLSRIVEALFTFDDALSRAVPVWHLGDSMDQLTEILELGFQQIGIGSHADFPIHQQGRVGERIREAMTIIGTSAQRVHLLCGLAPTDMARPFARSARTDLFIPDFHHIVTSRRPEAPALMLAA